MGIPNRNVGPWEAGDDCFSCSSWRWKKNLLQKIIAPMPLTTRSSKKSSRWWKTYPRNLKQQDANSNMCGVAIWKCNCGSSTVLLDIPTGDILYGWSSWWRSICKIDTEQVIWSWGSGSFCLWFPLLKQDLYLDLYTNRSGFTASISPTKPLFFSAVVPFIHRFHSWQVPPDLKL